MPRPPGAKSATVFDQPKSTASQAGFKRDPENVAKTKLRNDGEDAMIMKKLNNEFEEMFGDAL